jgi:hypothetical protein
MKVRTNVLASECWVSSFFKTVWHKKSGSVTCFQGVVMFALLYQQPLKYDEYNYPSWAEWIGWTLALSSILMIPLVAFISILQTHGTFKEVSMYTFLLQPGFL